MVRAYANHDDVTVAAAHDIWALGVIAFEALTQLRGFTEASAIYSCADGAQQYPWVNGGSTQWQASPLRQLVLGCVATQASERLSAAGVLSVAAALRRSGRI